MTFTTRKEFLAKMNILDAGSLLDHYEERAAICEYEGGMERGKAEQFSAKCYGFSCVTELKLYATRWEEMQ